MFSEMLKLGSLMLSKANATYCFSIWGGSYQSFIKNPQSMPSYDNSAYFE